MIKCSQPVESQRQQQSQGEFLDPQKKWEVYQSSITRQQELQNNGSVMGQ
jgi:hypothetical protein